jgi:hypothetical protein
MILNKNFNNVAANGKCGYVAARLQQGLTKKHVAKEVVEG